MIKIKNPNICDNCIPVVNYFLSTRGVCGRCGKVDECIDDELIRFYHANGIKNNDFFWITLPRLRGFKVVGNIVDESNFLTFDEINRLILNVTKLKPDIILNVRNFK